MPRDISGHLDLLGPSLLSGGLVCSMSLALCAHGLMGVRLGTEGQGRSDFICANEKLSQSTTSPSLDSNSPTSENLEFTVMTLISELQKERPRVNLKRVEIRNDSFEIVLDGLEISGCLVRNTFMVSDVAVIGGGKRFVHFVEKIVLLSNHKNAHHAKQIFKELELSSFGDSHNEKFFEDGRLRYHLVLVNSRPVFHLTEVDFDDKCLRASAPVI